MLVLNSFDINNPQEFKQAVYEAAIYVKDLNVCIRNYRGQLRIVDLANAMQPGKECNYVSFSFSDGDFDVMRGLYGFNHFLDDYPLSDVVNRWRNGYRYDNSIISLLGVRVTYGEVKSKRVFSPFLQPKKQNLQPANGKIRVMTFIKAILAGQIESITCDSVYTDDYAYDHATNYSKGKQCNLLDFAEEMLEIGSNAWSVWPDAENPKILNVAFLTSAYYDAVIK